MQEYSSWRDLLEKICSNPREKQRIADILGVRTITLTRWITRESEPRPQNLRNLLYALPQHREQLLELIRREDGFENFSEGSLENESPEIPSSFYALVFTTRASVTDKQRFWKICDLVLQHALEQLDPEHHGMSVLVVRCMKPSNGNTKVRSLRESIGRGTAPWPGDLENSALFLGAESLAGYVVSTCHYASIQNIADDKGLKPAQQVEYEKSAAIQPILYAGKVAGCLLVSSTQVNYFLAQQRISLIQSYADLLALAFDPKDFYEPEDIELRVMPPHSVQRKYFADFRARVSNVMLRAAREKKPLNSAEAETLVWQELEEELLNLPPTNEFD